MERRRQNPAAAFDVVAIAVSKRASARSLLEPPTKALANNRQWGDSSPLERERPLRQRLNARAAAQVSLLSRKRTPAQAAAGALTSSASNSLSANHNPQPTTLLSADSRARNRPFAFGFGSGGVDDGRASARPAALPQGHEGSIIQSGYS
jgi:hypothetical protein